MKLLSIFLLIVVFLLVLTSFPLVEVAAADDDVKFRGTILTDEDIQFPICYEMPYCSVLVEEVLHDSEDLLDLGFPVSVCYSEIMNLTQDERVEVYGFYFKTGPCPMQMCGHVVCEFEYGYYVARVWGSKAEFTAIPDTASTGESIKFDASASLPGWNGTHEMPIIQYGWNFGDGNKKATSTPIAYHSFSSSGIYYVTLTVYAPGATPETDSTTHKVTVISVPVGGYSFSIEGYTTEKPLTLYLALVAILTASFTLIKRKKPQKRAHAVFQQTKFSLNPPSQSLKSKLCSQCMNH